MEQPALDRPAYRIETDRLVLRCFELSDLDEQHALIGANLDHIAPWLPWAVHEPRTKEQRIEVLRAMRGGFDLGRELVYAIADRGSGALIGGTGFHPRIGPTALEIGYWIAHDHEGRGLVTEAAGALTRVAIEHHGVEWVEIRCDPANVRSAAVPRRLGYTLDGTLRRRARTPSGAPRDLMIWSIFADELDASPAKRVAYVARDARGETITGTGGA